MKIALITGTAGDIQGWGNMETTHALASSIQDNGHQAEVLYVKNNDELFEHLEKPSFDLVWSSLYHITEKDNSIEVPLHDKWVQDYLEHFEIPYIGTGSFGLKSMLDKHKTHKILSQHNVPVPTQIYIDSSDTLPTPEGQYIVKPCYGSNSTAIDETSVVSCPDALAKKVQPILNTLSQPVVIEEYLAGEEYTVLMLGNGEHRRFFSTINVIAPETYDHYPIVTSNLKYQHGISFGVPEDEVKIQAEAVAAQAADALGCLDHVRIDMRMDNAGKLKVIDANGIPGLSPSLGSRSLAIQELYHPQFQGPENYHRLVNTIIGSAAQRYTGSLSA